MRNILLLTAIGLAACATSNPSPPPAPVAQTAAQSEAQAASRDSSATQDQIKAVQGRLMHDGFYSGRIDGVWGPVTAAALSKYQSAHGLAVTGKLDDPTLDSFTASPPVPPTPVTPKQTS